MSKYTYSIIKGCKVLIKLADGTIGEFRHEQKPKTKTTVEDLNNLGIDIKIISIKSIKK